jgi:hypothetical protein
MINEVNNHIMEPNPYFHQQKAYLLQNTVDNNNNNNNYCFSASANDYNFQPINNNNIEEEKESFRPKTYTENFKKFEISDNNNYNSNFDDNYDENNMEEDTEKEAVEFYSTTT